MLLFARCLPSDPLGLMCSNNVTFLPLTIHASQVVCEKHSLLYMYYGGNVAILLFKF
jgi:hypothetical protein